MVYVFLADGFEETEALVPVDILRRGGVEVKTVGIGSKTVCGSHKIPVVCDITEEEVSPDNIKAIVLPGGMPGTLNLKKSNTVNSLIDFAADNGIIIGAICAAPSILGEKGLLKGKRATCFPGFEQALSGAALCEGPAVKDGNIITACGAGAAFQFGFLLLAALYGNDTADKLKAGMLYDRQ
ncbi:MAG: DJ-1/PfpI family protein [Clostridia bacterium]|nr:DJ-1/PfpI family protein [Clostridia bacterium]